MFLGQSVGSGVLEEAVRGCEGAVGSCKDSHSGKTRHRPTRILPGALGITFPTSQSTLAKRCFQVSVFMSIYKPCC